MTAGNLYVPTSGRSSISLSMVRRCGDNLSAFTFEGEQFGAGTRGGTLCRQAASSACTPDRAEARAIAMSCGLAARTVLRFVNGALQSSQRLC